MKRKTSKTWKESPKHNIPALETHIILTELQASASLLQKVLEDQALHHQIALAAEKMHQALADGKKILSCGNGGSHCDAMHFAEELSGRYRENRPALAAMAISDVSHITCTGNDFGFEYIFSRFIEGMGQAGDILLAISTSGNSANVIKAAEMARQKNMIVIALSGNEGGSLAPLADVEIRVPHHGYADRIQEIHIKIIHILIHLIEEKNK